MATAAVTYVLRCEYAAALMSGALLPIYHGAYTSLRTPQATLKVLKERKEEKGEEEIEDDEEDESVTLPETLTSEDAYWLPVIGSAVLFSMFLVFKYLDKMWVDRVLGFYFAVVGTFAVSKVNRLGFFCCCVYAIANTLVQVFLLVARACGAFRLVDAARYTLTKTTTDKKTAAPVRESE